MSKEKLAVHIKCVDGLIHCITTNDPNIRIIVSDREDDIFEACLSTRKCIPFGYEIITTGIMNDEIKQIGKASGVFSLPLDII